MQRRAWNFYHAAEFPHRRRFVPTYEYRCRKCGKMFERNEHISEHTLKRKRCPKCKSTQVAQVPGMFFAKTSKKS